MISRDRSPPPTSTDASAAKAEAVRAQLVAIEARLFADSAAASLDEQLAALRAVAFRMLGPVDG